MDYLQWIHLQNIITRAAEHVGVSELSGKRLEDVKDQQFRIIYYSANAPLILIILIFWLLTSLNLIFQ